MPPITLTGIAAIVAASVCLMQAGLRRCILHPYMFICLLYFQLFGFPLDDPEYAFVVDLAHLLAFFCFSMAFFQATRGSDRRIRRVLRYIWPQADPTRETIAALSHRAIMLLAVIALGYAAIDVWSNSLIYGGLDRSLLRFYVLRPEGDASPWLLRLSIWLGRMAIMVVFVLRLNYVLYGRGRLAMWLALLTSMAVAFPTGSAGKVIGPVFVCVIADILGILHQGKRLRPRMDMVALCTLAVCGGMFLHVIRATTFKNVSQVVDVVKKERETMSGRLASAAGHAHAIISEDTVLCMRTFGKSADFLPGHTFYTILVNPIPREMWPGKPLAFGRLLHLIKLGQYGRANVRARGASAAAGLAGEGYANGGYLGIVLLSLSIGYVCGKAAKAALIAFMMPSYPALLIGLGLYRFSSMFVRGDVHSAWMSTAYPLVLLILALWMWARSAHFFGTACRMAVFRLDREGTLL